MRVTAWSNGNPRPSGAGYGVRLSAADRDRHFDRSWTSIVLDLGAGEVTVVALSASFWRRCAELRSASIGRWLLGRGLAPWPKGQPPRLVLRHLHGDRFQLRHPEK
ncbi:hypothetical protein GTS_46760 [Gandjariella thermophila]|uniref:Uncharacterized protein n=1 Tax=Gandjariella thermophila TaxID=1931992 RepID=A0A4D4JGM1_9PSEU|nr:hypothetical protein GTS_46760 [Gandjariella thermophila]